MKDVIVAVATSTAGNAGVNIIRLSGEGVKKIIEKIFYSKSLAKKEMIPNMMYLGKIQGKNFMEQALCVFFKAPKSYTGEDVAEFHCHGGKGIAKAVMSLCIDKGARPATAGEFTKRAFLNGKMNLAQAEGIMEIINAESESQIMQSYRLLSGEISQGIYEMEERLIKVIAGLEVRLDYPEETEDEPNQPYEENIKEVIKDIGKLLEGAKHTKTITEGLNVAIIGLPNVGKSSLLNGLVMAERAIVTEHEGTTRDVLKEQIVLDGIKINLLDTAGIRQSVDDIEKIGIEKSRETIKAADIIIFLMDLSKPQTEQEKELENLFDDKKTLRVANKKDISRYPRENAIYIKAKPPRDIEELKNKILELAGKEEIFNSNIITTERHITCLKEAKEHFKKALKGFNKVPAECSLIDIREGYNELAKITGDDISESIIEEVFSTFCVGK